jgi:competence protein ComEC
VQICFFSVGLGDAILIIAPDGETMLIDGGSEGSGITGYLDSLGIRKVDVMVATHPHQDHIGGLADVLRALPVRQLYTNGQSNDDDSTYIDFRAAVASSGVKVTKLIRGNKIHLGELTFQVLNPQASASSDTNENSMVLRFSFRKTTVLLMGDADHNSESSILAAGLPVEADILKMGHHGAASSSSEAFLEAVSPSVAIYSSGYGNSFGLPEKAALDRVRQLGSKIYGTDKNGSIFVTINSNGYKVVVSKGE